MGQEDLLVKITRYVEARYQLNVSSADAELLIKKVSYLARARKDQRLYDFIDQYKAVKSRRVVPILNKKPIVLDKNI